MHPLLYSLTDGRGFFAGLGVTFFAVHLLGRFEARVIKSILIVFALLGVGIVLLSATPLHWSLYVIWIADTIVALTIFGRKKNIRRMLYFTNAALFTLVTLVMFGWELPHHLPRQVNVDRDTTVYVLGDSLSAGMGRGERLWPDVFAERTGLAVVNLAVPGARVRGAIKQREQIPKEPAVVIIEIGGNDMLSGGSSETFRTELNELVTSLRRDDHKIVIVELPLPPLHNGFGRAQRHVASGDDTTLLPKRHLAAVLADPDGTLDGLHFSNHGHALFAQRIARMVSVNSLDADLNRPQTE